MAQNNTYNINPYTIKYDSSTRRFFKGFAPKVGSGALLSGAIFAGLAVTTVVTGGLAGISAGLAAGTVGASVGAGAVLQTAYSGIVYRRNASNARFKKMSKDSNDELANIEKVRIIVEFNEAKAYENTVLLEDSDKQAQIDGKKRARKIELEDGSKYGRIGFKTRIRECEDIAYHGLKYLLNKAIETSKQIEKLQKIQNPNDTQRAKLKQSWDIVESVGDCVKALTFKRLNFNPYKGLIIDAMKQGCLLGDYAQNQEIRKACIAGDDKKIKELYFEMYERELLENNSVPAPSKIQLNEDEYNALQADKARAAQLENDLKAKGDENDALKQANLSLLDENTKLDTEANKNKAKYKQAVKTGLGVRDKNRLLKKMVADLTQQKRDAELRADDAAGAEYWQGRAENAEQTVEALYDNNLEVEAGAKYWQGRAENAEETVGALFTNLTEQEAANDALERDFENAATGWYDSEQNNTESARVIAGQAEQINNLTTERDVLERDFENAATDLYESEQQRNALQAENVEVNRRLADARKGRKKAEKRVKKLNNVITEQSTENAGLTSELDRAVMGWYGSEKNNAEERAKNEALQAENARVNKNNEALKKSFTEAALGLYASQRQAEESDRVIAQQGKQVARLTAERTHLAQMADLRQREKNALEQENIAINNKLAEVEVTLDEARKTLANVRKGRKDDKTRLETKNQELKSKYDELVVKYNELIEERDDLVDGQTANIARIMELEAEVRVLTEDVQAGVNVNPEDIEKAITTAEALREGSAALKKQLEGLTK